MSLIDSFFLWILKLDINQGTMSESTHLLHCIYCIHNCFSWIILRSRDMDSMFLIELKDIYSITFLEHICVP